MMLIPHARSFRVGFHPGTGLLLAALTAGFLVAAPMMDAAEANRYRGLWAGQVTLNFVNEVTVPLDKNNIPRAPDPDLPTPTADQAHLRLILHVNGSGQVNLLKQVAILNRKGGSNPLARGPGVVHLVDDLSTGNLSGARVEEESDLALVSDERLYGDFPPQPAIRIASAQFDFGDSKATEAVSAVSDAAVNAVAASVLGTTEDLTTAAGRRNAQEMAAVLGKEAGESIMLAADAAVLFQKFMDEELTAARLNVIAGAADPAAEAGPVLNKAIELKTNSFYMDPRAVEMVEAVLAAIAGAETIEEKRKGAHHAAASFADLENGYHRFLAGKIFGDMITGAAQAASAAAVASEAGAASIRAAVNGNHQVVAARSNALTLRITAYQDTRAGDAVNQVIEAMLDRVSLLLPASPGDAGAIQQAANETGRITLAQAVPRYARPSQEPTLEYNQFIASSSFLNAATLASEGAAAEAVLERRSNLLYTDASVHGAARIGAIKALRDVLRAAARAERTELPLIGVFAPGAGDPRLSWDIRQGNESALDPAGALEGAVFLPANHPTNPFRHRRHPDNTVGFDVRREIRLDFDGSAEESLPRAGFGVERVSGIYREEIFGLHKPLGPEKNTGLKVEGKFELHRISLIDTLNAR
jgi:hypothetical protein